MRFNKIPSGGDNESRQSSHRYGKLSVPIGDSHTAVQRTTTMLLNINDFIAALKIHI
jgi:hypothetical protein